MVRGDRGDRRLVWQGTGGGQTDGGRGLLAGDAGGALLAGPHRIWTGAANLADHLERKTSATTVYASNLYEKNLATGEVTKSYYAGSRRIAVRRCTQLSYLLADHLGSTVATVDPIGGDPLMPQMC